MRNRVRAGMRGVGRGRARLRREARRWTRKSVRWQVRDVAGVVVLMVLLVVVVKQIAGSGERVSRGELSVADRSRLCAEVRHAGEHLAHQHPESADKVTAATDAACASGFPMAPTNPASVAGASVGCAPGLDRPAAPVRHRAVAPPTHAVPFFAPRAGRLPRDGAVTVGAVALPSGSRCPHYWATDAPVRDAVALAARLAEAFPRTGLWPVLWDDWDDPDSLTVASGDPRAADRLDPEQVLAKVWAGYRNRGPFPGLAAGSRGPAITDPFQALVASGTLRASTGDSLLLVPVNRPADAIAMVGSLETEVAGDPQLTAVVRSWEERFGAVVTTIGPGLLGLSIGRPPRDLNQARLLVAEHDAFAPESDYDPDADRAQALLRGTTGDERRDFWDFGWPD